MQLQTLSIIYGICSLVIIAVAGCVLAKLYNLPKRFHKRR